MTSSSLFSVSSVVTALVFLSIPAHAVCDDKLPPTLVAGLNNGMNKIALAVTVGRDKLPVCRLRFARLAIGQEPKFGAWVAEAGLDYVGRRDVDADGDQWTEYLWKVKDGRKLRLAHPVRSIGPKFLAHFKKYGYDVAKDRLPFALVMLESGNVIPFPLRDAAKVGAKDLEAALLGEKFALEKSADTRDFLLYIDKALRASDDENILRMLGGLAHLSKEIVQRHAARLLLLRDHENSKIHTAAQAICRKHHLFSAQDVMKACRKLESRDLKTVRENYDFIESLETRIWRRAIPALEKLLARDDLDAKLCDRAKKHLERLRKFRDEMRRRVRERRR